MNLFRTLAVTFNSKVKHIANEFENHEAIATSIIKEVEHKTAKARIQLMQVKNDLIRQKNTLQKLEKDKALWNQRIKTVYPIDKKRALECAKRFKRIQEDIQNLEKQIKETQSLEKQLSLNLSKIEQQLTVLRRQKNTLSSRQNCAEALNTLQTSNPDITDEMNQLFQRWETKVTEWEIQTDHPPLEEMFDDFEEDFIKEEEKQDLQSLVDKIIQNEPTNDFSEKKE